MGQEEKGRAFIFNHAETHIVNKTGKQWSKGTASYSLTTLGIVNK